jgi:hypothetical protein
MLADLVSKATEVHLLRFYGPFHRSPTSAAGVLAKAVLARSAEDPFFAAGAVLAARPGDARHAERLRGLLASDWRQRRPFMWMHIARALGLAGDAASVQALRATRAVLSADDDRTARQRRAIDAALALAGDEAARSRLLASLADPAADAEGAYLALGLGVQWANGDATAAGRLQDLWKAAGPFTRLQIGMSVLSADRDPAADLPADDWARELSASDSRATRALARGYLLRRKAPGALEALLAELREDLPLLDETELRTLDGDAGSGVVEALRALARWS